MYSFKDNQLIEDGNSSFELSILTIIGDRDDQQDAFGYSLKGDEGIVLVCDGMGGHEGGKIASTLTVEQFVSDYDDSFPCNSPEKAMVESALRADRKVHALSNENGELLSAGSTVCAIVIKNKKLYWCSIGDSRAYLSRGNEFVQFTQDQNYKTVLNGRYNSGLISIEEYEKEEERKDALISYVGIGALSLIDYNKFPIPLEKGDRITIMSDGLYKLVDNPEMQGVIENFTKPSEAIQALNEKAKNNAKRNRILQDNLTVALIEIK